MTIMRLRLGVLLLMAFLSVSLIAQVQAYDEERAVQEAYRAYVHAWKIKDLMALDKLISADYTAVNAEGKVSTKENEIATAKSDLAWEIMSVDEIRTRVWGDAAVASGFISAQGKKPDGSPFSVRVRFLAGFGETKWTLAIGRHTIGFCEETLSGRKCTAKPQLWKSRSYGRSR